MLTGQWHYQYLVYIAYLHPFLSLFLSRLRFDTGIPCQAQSIIDSTVTTSFRPLKQTSFSKYRNEKRQSTTITAKGD